MPIFAKGGKLQTACLHNGTPCSTQFYITHGAIKKKLPEKNQTTPLFYNKIY
jgi:hypothetical protein